MSEQLVNYNITDAAIGEMREKYLKLRIVDLDDKDGAKAVDAARRAVKAKRCEVERLRKELKADALEWGRKVDSEAKRITEMLLPIEQHLEGEEARIEQERARIKAEEEARAEAERKAEMERIMRRVQTLALLGVCVGPEAAGAWSEMEYEEALEEAQRAQAEREAERKAEEQRLEQVRKEQEAERERLKKLQEELDAREREEANRRLRDLQDRLPVIVEHDSIFDDPDLAAECSPPAAVIDLPAEFRYVDDPAGGIPGVICVEIQTAPPAETETTRERYQVKVTGLPETFYCPTPEKLFNAILQWIDEIAGEGDTLSVTVFNMTDAQYEDLIRSIDAKESQ